MRLHMSGKFRRRMMSVFVALAIVLAGLDSARADGISDYLCNAPFSDLVCAPLDTAAKAVEFASDPLGYLAQAIKNSLSSAISSLVKDVQH